MHPGDATLSQMFPFVYLSKNNDSRSSKNQYSGMETLINLHREVQESHA